MAPPEAGMSAHRKRRYTPEEYLALERDAELESEYVDGEIVAMSGASEPGTRWRQIC
jgi:Uma2 family endonuclease